ncbi:MAG: DUF3857 domain-containing protein [Bacteroidales bacterium]|nr:DUF3857 domain-containing protein [Bacteroidales bacterium]
MKKSYFVIILAIFFLVSIPVLKAQNENQDAEYIKVVKEYILHEDGSYDYHYRKELKLLTYFSFQRLYGETFIVYNPEYQKLKINEAYTVMADGKKVIAPENAFNEVLPGFARDVAAYNHLREMVVTHTGTERGCVITLDYTIQTAKGFLPFFFGMEEIGENAPVKDLSIIIRIPQILNLQYRLLNSRTAPDITELAGQLTYLWNFRNVQALPRSANQDPERKANLIFSAAKDMTWAYFSFVNQPAFKSSVSPEISRRVESVTKEKKNDLDIILTLQEVVIDEVKLADIPLVYTGYRVRTPAEVWQSANANGLEKAILLSEMLKMANINACPVATVPNGWFSREMGNLAVFDSYLVQVNPKETGRIYLSVIQKQSQNLIYDVLDKTLIQLDGAIESMRTFQEKPQTNLLQMEAKIRLYDDKTVGGEMELELEGIVNPYFRLRKDSSYVKNLLAGDITSAQIDKTELKQLSELKSKSLITTIPIIIKTDYNGFVFFELPRYKTGFDAWNLGQFSGSGTTPVKLDYQLWENYKYKIEIPAEYELFTPPVDLEIKNVLGELKIHISQSGQTVTIVRSFENSHDVITSDNMDEFRSMLTAWENVNWRKIVLKKK